MTVRARVTGRQLAPPWGSLWTPLQPEATQQLARPVSLAGQARLPDALPPRPALAPSGAGQRSPALRVRPSCPAEDAASPAPRTHSANGSRSRRSEHAVASVLQCTVCQWGTPGLHPRWQRSARGSNRSHADLT